MSKVYGQGTLLPFHSSHSLPLSSTSFSWLFPPAGLVLILGRRNNLAATPPSSLSHGRRCKKRVDATLSIAPRPLYPSRPLPPPSLSLPSPVSRLPPRPINLSPFPLSITCTSMLLLPSPVHTPSPSLYLSTASPPPPVPRNH